MPTIKKLEFATGVDVTAPADPSLESSTKQLAVYVDEAAYVTANGAATEGDFFFDSTLNVVKVYDGAAWSEVGSGGSGAGELNLIDNPNDALLGWDASGAGVTVTTSNTSTDLPLSGLIETSIKITPVSGTTDHARYRFTMPVGLMGRKLKVEWYQRPLSGYASGDLKFDVYTNSASNYGGSYTRVVLSTDSSAVTSIPNANGKFTTTFDASTEQYYEIRFTRVSGTTALNITNVICGPGIQPQGSVVGEWNTGLIFTASAGFGTVTASTIENKRVGSDIYVRGTWTNGTVAASTMSIALPSGAQIDSSKLPARATLLGYVQSLSSTSSTTQRLFQVFYDGSDTANVYITDAYGSSTFTKRNGSTVLSNSDGVSFEFSYPVSQYAGSGTVNLAENEVEYASNSSSTDAADTTSFAYGPAGSAGILGTTGLTDTRKKRVRFINPIGVNDLIVLEAQSSSTSPWMPMIGWAYDTGTDTYAVPSYYNFVDNGTSTTTAGVALQFVSGSTTDVDVIFGRSATRWAYGTGSYTSAWSGYTGARWRVRKVKNGLAVGFGIVNETSSGLMPASHINLDNAASTRLGFKAYAHGTTYNGGAAPTITGVSTVAFSEFIPYQMQDGGWRMKVCIDYTTTSSARTDHTITINGITSATALQPLAALGSGGAICNSRLNSATNTITTSHASATTDSYRVNGDVKLASKPTWAY